MLLDLLILLHCYQHPVRLWDNDAAGTRQRHKPLKPTLGAELAPGLAWRNRAVCSAASISDRTDAKFACINNTSEEVKPKLAGCDGDLKMTNRKRGNFDQLDNRRLAWVSLTSMVRLLPVKDHIRV